jgi:hypothetical protein
VRFRATTDPAGPLIVTDSDPTRLLERRLPGGSVELVYAIGT